jgi:HD domain
MLESRARKDSHAAALFGILTPIVDDVTPLLEFIRRSFPGYPKHGIDHSLRILERIGGILSKAALNSLSTNELFCLILAAVFHDAGMVAPDSDIPNDESIRATHHKRSAELFLQYFPDRLALLNNARMAQAVAFAIECHGLSWEEMQIRPEFSKYETLDGQPIRPCILALLLRIGDLLDLDSDRTSDLCLKHCASWYGTPDAVNHNDRHHHVKHFFIMIKRSRLKLSVLHGHSTTFGSHGSNTCG